MASSTAESAELAELRRRLGEIADLGTARRPARLGPRDGDAAGGRAPRAARSRRRSRRSRHQRLADPAIGELLASVAEQAAGDPDGDAAAIARVVRRDHDRAVRVPSELVAEMARATAAALPAWQEARANSDFERFRPFLERNVELRREVAACFPEAEHPYDALLDVYEPGRDRGDRARRLRPPARRARAARRADRRAPGARAAAGALQHRGSARDRARDRAQLRLRGRRLADRRLGAPVHVRRRAQRHPRHLALERGRPQRRSSRSCTRSATASTRPASTPRSTARRSARASRSASTSRRAACGRTRSAAGARSGATGCRAPRRRSRSSRASASTCSCARSTSCARR